MIADFYGLEADADWPRTMCGCGLITDAVAVVMLAWPEHERGLLVDADSLRPRPVLGRSEFVELPRLRP